MTNIRNTRTWMQVNDEEDTRDAVTLKPSTLDSVEVSDSLRLKANEYLDKLLRDKENHFGKESNKIQNFLKLRSKDFNTENLMKLLQIISNYPEKSEYYDFTLLDKQLRDIQSEAAQNNQLEFASQFIESILTNTAGHIDEDIIIALSRKLK